MQDPPAPPDTRQLPTIQQLKEAALAYLARYAASEAGVRRVLERRIETWCARHPALPSETKAELTRAVDEVVAELARKALVDDAAYAQMKSASLRRGGRSGRSVRAKLLAQGVAMDVVRTASPDDPEADLVAALMTVRRRQLGRFRRGDDLDAARMRRDVAKLVRHGFSVSIAQRAVDMTPEEAETLIRNAHD